MRIPASAARRATAIASSSWFSPSVMRITARLRPSPSPENDSSACSSALPMAVPCTATCEGSMRRAKAFAMRWSEVTGSCTLGSPANTISPTRSCRRPSKSLSRAYLVRSRRLGSKSSASIEFETSTAIIISMPCARSSRSFDPNWGRAAARASSPTAAAKRTNLSTTRPVETSGISSRRVSGLPKRARRRRRRRSDHANSSVIAGTRHSSQRYWGFANRNMVYGRTGRSVSSARTPTRPVVTKTFGVFVGVRFPPVRGRRGAGRGRRGPGLACGRGQGMRFSTSVASRNSAARSAVPSSTHTRKSSW